MDESTVYSNALNIVQVQDIYAAGSAGKQPVNQNNPVHATFNATGIVNNVDLAAYDSWSNYTYSFIATTSSSTISFSPNNNGVLLDSIQLYQIPPPNPANYYLPEESLAKLKGENSKGDWKLEVMDNRAGANSPTPNLISWQLSLVLERQNPAAIALTNGIANTNIVAPGFTAYYSVLVPAWATMATNILITASAPVNVFFTQNQEPFTGGLDYTLFNNVTAGTTTLSSGSTPPLVPGQTYYLGVQNNGVNPVTFSIEVDFDITPLTNGIPFAGTLNNSLPRYFSFDVSSNALAVLYELTNVIGNGNLVVSKGLPLPDLVNHAYQRANVATSQALITVSSNTLPVGLAPGRWYLGVFNQGAGTLNYNIEALEIGPPTIIVLTNDEVLTTNFSPVAALNTLFQYGVSNGPVKALFELYNLNGDVDLVGNLGTYPLAPPYQVSSANPGVVGEQIVVRTNGIFTNLNGNWYLRVPNNTTSNVTFTIHVVEDNGGMLLSQVPLSPVATQPPVGSGVGPTITWTTVVGETYLIETSTDLVHWTIISPPSPITAIGTSYSYTDPNPISGTRYYRIIQIPGP